MSKAKAFDKQFDLFVPFVADLPLRDQRETMERPFFSLSKKKRIKPIEYTSPDGGVYVKITADAEYGMATIWDADILIWAASNLCDQKKKGINDISRTLKFQPYDLLKTINRDTGGREYKLLGDALRRLQATQIATNIRAEKSRRKGRQFSWIQDVEDVTDVETGAIIGLSFTLSEWFYEGVLTEGSVLAIDPEYFSIKGGRERWLYRVARKHAGGAGEQGFAIALPTLFDKSGAEGTYRRFKFEMLKLAREDALPSFALRIENKGAMSEPILHMFRRELAPSVDAPAPRKPRPSRRAPGKPRATDPLPLFGRTMSEVTLQKLKTELKGWDVYALKAEFDAWLDDDATREPKNYDAALQGFARRYVKERG